MIRRLLALPLLLAAALGLSRCAAKIDPPAETPPPAADKFTFEGTQADGGAYFAFGAAMVVNAEYGGAITTLQLTEFGHACDEHARIHRGSRYVDMTLARKVAVDGGTFKFDSPNAAGTIDVWDGGDDFTLQPETVAFVRVYRPSTTDCTQVVDPGDTGESGHVILENFPKIVSGGAYGAFEVPMKGSFDVRLQNGGTLKGTFELPRCAPYMMDQTCF